MKLEHIPEKIDPSLNLEQIREECLDLVKKRAYFSAGAAVIPVPFLDVVIDVGILSQLIPEINADHLGLIETQRRKRGFDKGFIVTNPNCAVISFAPPLAALHRKYGIESVFVTTLQAISGAGYPGVASMDITDNVFPYIAGEEPKVEIEAQKILGVMTANGIEKADFAVSAQCFRVNVVDGHMVSVRVDLKETATLEEVVAAMREFPSLDLHSSPSQFIEVTDEPSRPQTRLDRDAGHAWVGFPLDVLLAIAVACASYYILERPLLDLRRRLAGAAVDQAP